MLENPATHSTTSPAPELDSISQAYCQGAREASQKLCLVFDAAPESSSVLVGRRTALEFQTALEKYLDSNEHVRSLDHEYTLKGRNRITLEEMRSTAYEKTCRAFSILFEKRLLVDGLKQVAELLSSEELTPLIRADDLQDDYVSHLIIKELKISAVHRNISKKGAAIQATQITLPRSGMAALSVRGS